MRFDTSARTRVLIRPSQFQLPRLSARDSAPPWWLVWLVLALLCAGFFFYGINAGELYRTESLRAIIAAEVLRSGNWIVPRLYGEPLFTKPPGAYAAIALASLPFGDVTEWSARLPSALAASLLVILFYSLFSRFLGSGAAMIAAGVVPLSMMMLDKATSAEIDMLQVTWVAGGIYCIARVLECSEFLFLPSQSLVVFWWLAALLCVAGGFLTKWTAPAFFYFTVVPMLLWRRQLRMLWSASHLLAVVVAGSLCAAWAAAAIWCEGWETFYSTIERQALMHLSSTHQQRPYPWLEALVNPFRVLGAALPISLFALPALSPRFMRSWDERGRCLLQLFHCWLWPNLLFWTIVPAHNTRHSFPIYPAIAGFAVMTWFAWFSGRLEWRWRWMSPAKALVSLVIFWCIAKLVFVHSVTPDRLHAREPRAKGEHLRSLVPEGETLHLFRLKDEGIMFYYGRPVRRLRNLDALPATGEPLYCILDVAESGDINRTHEVLLRTQDQQGEPIVLVRLAR